MAEGSLAGDASTPATFAGSEPGRPHHRHLKHRPALPRLDLEAVVVRAAPAEGGEGMVAEFVPVRVLAQAAGRSAVEGLTVELAPGDRMVLTGADNAFPGASLLAAGAAGPGPDGGAEAGGEPR